MSVLLQVTNLSKQYSGQRIFENLTFSVAKKQKIGVIGRNGAGKSTLFKIILGHEQADTGEVMISDEAHIGYLKQEEVFDTTESGLDYLLRSSGKEEWTARKLAGKFELDAPRLAQSALSLSGGWQMRLKLVGMLLTEPNLFLLDEPTNYLDLNTLILLENYLRSYRGGFLIISHDREFLKQTCNETLEISPTHCYHYQGGLEAYLAFKEQKLATLIKANEGLGRQQEHLQDFVDRFRFKSSKAKQAQAVIRKIEKLEAKRITIEHKAGITRITMPPIIKRKSTALRVKHLDVGYKTPVVTDIDFDVTFGEHLAVLGLNGQGKTTFLKTIAGELEPLNGTYSWFADCNVQYHAQQVMEVLDGSVIVENYLRQKAAADVKTERVLKMAGDFLFEGMDLKKPIGVLSGGEKSRLMLAGILLSKPDILILDEPTSHLDFETAEALGSALIKYHGAIIFTSHDRTFTSLVATGIIEIADGAATRYFQEYDDYVNYLEQNLISRTDGSTTDKEPETKTISSNYQNYLDKKVQQKQITALEKSIDKLKTKQQTLMDYFVEHPLDYEFDKIKELKAVEDDIKAAENEWLELNT